MSSPTRCWSPSFGSSKRSGILLTRGRRSGVLSYAEVALATAAVGLDDCNLAELYARAVPEGGEPLFGFDITAHEGHFMGHGKNRLLVFPHDGRDYLRAAGTWDPMLWHVASAYELAGREAQHTFWGDAAIVRWSMLHQIALGTA